MKTSTETRIKAYKLMKELKKKEISKKETVDRINKEFEISTSTLYDWYAGRNAPWESKEKIENLEYNKELFYILGAMLGDGCIYYWRGQYQVKIYGEEEFIRKCAEKLSICLRKNINHYFYKSYYEKWGSNLWFINTVHKKLFILFKEIRSNPYRILDLMGKSNYKENSLQFVEGFFDAEGCVKIIKEKVRKIPKICPDICCTDYEYVELCRKLLKKHLNIEARYSIQKPKKHWNAKKTSYHLRIYRKEYVRRFFENINTTKLKPEKIQYVKNWLKNKDKKEIITLLPS
ncbi:MAG: hypothetical protein CMH64_04310 [Nanoarchaeota archaeon]|nr:hypothetical protein [Nanoarchaeota archaeon]|tara:strand:- start:1209 stop:2075 length:867 start_codon:yes stop_codon:yes gene_type:complete